MAHGTVTLTLHHPDCTETRAVSPVLCTPATPRRQAPYLPQEDCLDITHPVHTLLETYYFFVWLCGPARQEAEVSEITSRTFSSV